MRVDKLPGVGQLRQQAAHDIAVLSEIVPSREIKLMVVDPSFAAGDHPQLAGVFGVAEQRIPHHPGVHRQIVAGGQRVFRRGIDHPHVVQPQPGVLEDLQQQPVDIRPFIEGDAFTAQIAELANVALLRDDHRHAARRRRLPRHVHQFAIAGLGKHRRRFSGGAEVDLVAGEGVKELRSGGKLAPQHDDAEAGEGGLQTLAGFQDPEAAEALVANAQLAIGPGRAGECPRRRRRAAAAFDQPEVSELGAQGMPTDP